MDTNKVIKVFNEQELSYQKQREILMGIIAIIKEHNLSLNQAAQILDLTKETLGKKTLWS